ncbi:MAG: CNNM domain-containing protein, partial [Planctomycetota bacterium]
MVPGLIALFLVCLLLSAFFSGSEIALLSSSRLRLRRLAAEGDRPAARVLELVAEPRRLLAGILIGNNLMNVLAAAVATVLCTGVLGPATGVAVATVASTALFVLFAEFLLPLLIKNFCLLNSLAAHHPVRMARWVASPMRLAVAALRPAVAPLEAVSRPFAGLGGRKGADRLGPEDLRMAVAEGVRSGALDERMARVLRGGLSLTWKRVDDVLVPRVDVRGVESGRGYAECLEAFRRERKSRLLVMEGGPDRDVGYVAARDHLLVP